VVDEQGNVASILRPPDVTGLYRIDEETACATSATTCPTQAHPISSTSGGLILHTINFGEPPVLVLVPEERKAGPFTVVLNWPVLLEKK